MQVRTRAFHVPKRGNSESEYEDAVFPETGCDREMTQFRGAVADGASESVFAGLWAQLLVRSFGRRRLRLGRLRRLWQRRVGGAGGSGASLPWYLQNKSQKGAYAAFVGLALRQLDDGAAAPADADAAAVSGNGQPGPAGVWRVVAVGDSCFFQVRDGRLLASGPVGHSTLFGNTPYLLSSKASQRVGRQAEHVELRGGAWRSGDVFYLATDALAQWLLAEHEAGRAPWPTLAALDPQQEKAGNGGSFAELVDALRKRGDLHNDDTTLLRVEVE